MNNNDQEFSPQVLALARQVATEMLALDESFRQVPYGHKTGTFYLSKDNNALINDGVITVNGINFYIGVLKKPKG